MFVSLRKATYTYGNIMERKAFTVSVPPERYATEADYFGMASGSRADKFAAAKLTPAKSNLVDAPYVEEFPLVLECKVIHIIKIGLHTPIHRGNPGRQGGRRGTWGKRSTRCGKAAADHLRT